MTATLLHGATVVTVDRERRIIDDGAVLIDGGLISAVATAPDEQMNVIAPEPASRPHETRRQRE